MTQEEKIDILIEQNNTLLKMNESSEYNQRVVLDESLKTNQTLSEISCKLNELEYRINLLRMQH